MSKTGCNAVNHKETTSSSYLQAEMVPEGGPVLLVAYDTCAITDVSSTCLIAATLISLLNPLLPRPPSSSPFTLLLFFHLRLLLLLLLLLLLIAPLFLT